jgi:acetylornithine deacetylase/succinyl-diaminopimelate desuccinylase-like protein
MTTSIDQFFSDNRKEHLKQLKEFLGMPSISALSKHKEDVATCANWLAEDLQRIGLQSVKVLPTKGHPVVYGERIENRNKPTVLVYGHYDVQPVDPLNLWETPPFEPDIRDEKIYSRGASDDKGQVFMHVKAVEALLKTEGALPVNVKFCIEGEEEIGSPNLDAFVEEHKDLLAADVLVVSDSPILEKGRPAICYGLRGLCGIQIDVFGPKSDLHSGLYGGALQNPIHALTELLAGMHDKDGRVAIEGFYDDVVPLSEEERREFQALSNDEALKSELDVNELFGEKGYTPLERIWARPTLEMNGIYGGFQEEGIKTVIPSSAHAKITCRLIEDQEPDKILELIEAHIGKHTPPGVKITTTRFDKGKPFKTPIDHPAIQAAAKAYESSYGVDPAYIRMGGSIPIVETFGHTLKLPVVLMGFGLPTENFHAPNEHFHLENFDKGLLTICEFYKEISKDGEKR